MSAWPIDPAATIFWSSVLAIGYVYVGYPVLLTVWARLISRGGDTTKVSRRDTFVDARTVPPVDRRPMPGVTIVLVVRNEAPRLAARLENLLGLAYPGPRQIVVASDGSTDGTTAILGAYRGRIEFLDLPSHGKWAALNAGVAHARHEIVVFADARQAFAPDALFELVTPFADARIGAVSGELLLDAETGERRRHADRRTVLRRHAFERRIHPRSVVADGMGLYWRYEKALRRMESRVGSTLGTTGAIWALRRSLWQPLPPDTLLDDVLTPMRVVLAGRRVVFQDSARAFDRVSDSPDAETRRKVRTLAGNVQILWLEPRLLLPIVNPVWLQYVSHKLGRLLVPYALLAAFLANIWLAPRHVLYAATMAAQIAFYLLAAYGAYLDEDTSRLEPFPQSAPAAPRWPARPSNERSVI